jgi:Cdc6-like AAA superfamily ATPase
MLPASPKIFYGRDEEIQHLTKTMTLSAPARIVVCGAEGLGKTAVAVAASHSPEISQMFGQHRYFVECEGATDAKQLVAAIAQHLNLEGTSRKHVIRHLAGLAKEGEPAPPVLLVLDALDRAWKPHENRTDVEDFLSLLADLQHLTLMVRPSLPRPPMDIIIHCPSAGNHPRRRAPAPSEMDAPLPADTAAPLTRCHPRDLPRHL